MLGAEMLSNQVSVMKIRWCCWTGVAKVVPDVGWSWLCAVLGWCCRYDWCCRRGCLRCWLSLRCWRRLWRCRTSRCTFLLLLCRCCSCWCSLCRSWCCYGAGSVWFALFGADDPDLAHFTSVRDDALDVCDLVCSEHFVLLVFCLSCLNFDMFWFI